MLYEQIHLFIQTSTFEYAFVMASSFSFSSASSAANSTAAAPDSSDLLSDMSIPTTPGYEFSDDDDSQREINNDPEGSDVEPVDEEHHLQYAWIHEDEDEDDEDLEDSDPETEIYGCDEGAINTIQPIHTARINAWVLSLPDPIEMDPLPITDENEPTNGFDPEDIALMDLHNELYRRNEAPVEWADGFEEVRDWVDSLPIFFDWGRD